MIFGTLSFPRSADIHTQHTPIMRDTRHGPLINSNQRAGLTLEKLCRRSRIEVRPTALRHHRRPLDSVAAASLGRDTPSDLPHHEVVISEALGPGSVMVSRGRRESRGIEESLQPRLKNCNRVTIDNGFWNATSQFEEKRKLCELRKQIVVLLRRGFRQRQTYTQGHSIYRASTASRGKNTTKSYAYSAQRAISRDFRVTHLHQSRCLSRSSVTTHDLRGS